MVQQKNGPDCAAVLRAMLHATTSYETEAKVIISGLHMLLSMDPRPGSFSKESEHDDDLSKHSIKSCLHAVK